MGRCKKKKKDQLEDLDAAGFIRQPQRDVFFFILKLKKEKKKKRYYKVSSDGEQTARERVSDIDLLRPENNVQRRRLWESTGRVSLSVNTVNPFPQ